MVNRFKLSLKKESPYIFAAFGILLLAILLRSYNLLSLPIFADEAIYIRWSQIMKNDATLRFLPLTDGKQPLFMWVIIPFFKFFSDPLIAGRMVSVVCGLSAIVGVSFLTQILFNNKKISLIAAFFYAIAPYLVFFNRMALVDTMLAMFGIWAIFFAVLTAKTLRLDFALITGFCLGGALLTKFPGIFFVLLLPTTFLFVQQNKKVSLFTRSWKVLCYWAVSATVAYVMYNILKLGPDFHLLSIRNKDYLFSFSEIIKHPLGPISNNIGQFGEWVYYFTPLFFAIIALTAFILVPKKNWKEVLVLSLWFVIPVSIELETARVFTARYLLFALFPLYILSAVGAYYVVKKLNKYALVIIALLCIGSLYLDYLIIAKPENAILPRNERAGYLEAWTAGTGIGDVAEVIKQEHNLHPDEHIVVGSEGSFGALPQGLQLYIEDLPNVNVVGHDAPDLVEVDMKLIVAKKAGDKVYLVINASRFNAPYDKFGLVVLNQYPKAIRPNGTHDSLMLFEVTDKAVDVYNKNHEVKPSRKI